MVVDALKTPRIGYAALSPDLQAPGDRRRFVAYARARNLQFEAANPNERYDLVVLTEGADISVWADYRYGKIVYDLIDSYLSVPRTDVKQFLRGPAWYLLGRHKKLRFDYVANIQAMCRRAAAVICSTQEQQDRISQFCDNVHIILDLHAAVVRRVKEDYAARRPVRMVWEGLPSNLPQLVTVGSVLRGLLDRGVFELHVVTDLKRPRLNGMLGDVDTGQFLIRHFSNAVFHPWTEATCAKVVTECDIGLIPIDLEDPFARGKPENKLLLLWRMGMPVVVSATPAYRRAMAAAGTPDLACSNDGCWTTAITRLMTDQDARRDAATRGKAYAETAHSAEEILTRWDSLFESLGYSFGRRHTGHRPLAGP